MKKIVCILLLLAISLTPSHFARAESSLSLDEGAILKGMGGSWQQGYTPIVQNNTMTLHLPLTGEASEKIIAELVTPDNSPFTGEYLKGEFTKNSDGIWPVVFKARLSQVRTSGDYECTLRITSQNGAMSEIPLILPLRDGVIPKEAVHPLISDLSADFKVGEAGTLLVTLTNPGEYAALTNLMLKITDPTGDILPAGSDTIPVPDLMPEKSLTLELPALVRANASVSLHLLNLAIDYTMLDTDSTWEETFTLPVNQEIRMELGSIDMAATILQKDTATLALPIMNLGRGELRNVAAHLTLPGITDGQTVLVGTIAPGETGRAQLSFTPSTNVLGEVAGELKVTCEDAWGNSEEKVLPVAISVEKAMEPVVLTVEEEESLPLWIPWALGIGCILLTAAMILQGALLRRKIHHLEEEKL